MIFNPVIYKTCTNVPNVKSGANGTLGYIQVLRFTSQTARDVEEAIKSLQVPPIPFKQSPKTSIVHQSKGVDRYLLDLRNNGGGSFPAGLQFTIQSCLHVQDRCGCIQDVIGQGRHCLDRRYGRRSRHCLFRGSHA